MLHDVTSRGTFDYIDVDVACSHRSTSRPQPCKVRHRFRRAVAHARAIYAPDERLEHGWSLAAQRVRLGEAFGEAMGRLGEAVARLGDALGRPAAGDFLPYGAIASPPSYMLAKRARAHMGKMLRY